MGRISSSSLIRSSTIRLISAVILLGRPEPGCLAIVPVAWYTFRNFATPYLEQLNLSSSSALAMDGGFKPWLNQKIIRCFLYVEYTILFTRTMYKRPRVRSFVLVLYLDCSIRPQQVISGNTRAQRKTLEHSLGTVSRPLR